jgi:hypothetical protein
MLLIGWVVPFETKGPLAIPVIGFSAGTHISVVMDEQMDLALSRDRGLFFG